jgi:hypothetical protein
MYKGKIARPLSTGLAAALWLVLLLSLSETATANDWSFATVHDRIFPKSGAYKLDTPYKCADGPTTDIRGEQGLPVQCPPGKGEARALYDQMDPNRSESKQFDEQKVQRINNTYYDIRYTKSSQRTLCYMQTTPKFGANYVCVWKSPKGVRFTSQSNEY